MILLLPERLQEKIVPVTESGCWVWIGAWDGRGYGNTRWEGRYWKAHKLVWTLLRGPVPEGLELDHLCRVRACVNPDHQEPVTHRVNILRGVCPSALHAVKTHCPSAHAYDTENTYTDKTGSRHCRTCHRIQEGERVKRMRCSA